MGYHMNFTIENKVKTFDYITVLLTGCLGIFLIVIRKSIEEFLTTYFINKPIKWFKKWFKKNHNLSEKEINKDTNVKTLLVELRTLTHGDRTSVFQFHNGNIFSSSNDIFRVSATHESVSEGISSEIGSLQSIIASSITELISCFWREDNIDGVIKVSPTSCTCGKKLGQCNMPHGVYLYDVQKLEDGFAKAHLERQGIKYSLVSPLLSDQNRIGFISVDYVKEINPQELLTHATEMCRYGGKISYLIAHKSK